MRHSGLMLTGSLWLCIALPGALPAQTTNSDPVSHNRYDVFGGYSFLSNSFNGNNVPLNGWDAGIAFRAWHQLDTSRPWHRLGVKTDASGYYGTSDGAPQRPIFLLVGPQYTWKFSKNSPFIEGQVGFGHLNSDWFYPKFLGNSNTPTNSFAAFLGAGLDRQITPRLAFRVEGGMLRTNFTVPNPDGGIHGLPNYFARISTGLVWHF